MFEWSEEQQMIRDAVRQFVQAEIAPRREELEHGDLPPYDILRKLFATFGMDAMARERFKVQIEREKSGEPREERTGGRGGAAGAEGAGGGSRARAGGRRPAGRGRSAPAAVMRPRSLWG